MQNDCMYTVLTIVHNLICTLCERKIFFQKIWAKIILYHFYTITVMALLFTRRYFHEFHEKVAFRENIIVNSYGRVALLQCYILASQQISENKIANVHQNHHS